MAVDRGVKIRGMTEADLPKVDEIDRLLFGKERVSTWAFSVEAYWKTHRATLTFVAELNSEVTGFLLGSIRRARRMVPLVGCIDIMGVHPDYQRKGIGRRLVEAFCKECSRRSATASVVIKKNDKGLRKFFTELGFREGDLVTFEK